MNFARIAAAVLLCTALTQVGYVTEAFACGCLSPPVPEFDDDEYAVNQSAEQIIFEVEPDGFISAHVLIRYAGAPSDFAWIVPVPSAPELSLSESELFGIFDVQTEPIIFDQPRNICPETKYFCQFPSSTCFDRDLNNVDNINNSNNINNANSTNNVNNGVNIIDRQQIGSYETVTFAAQDASLAVTWLESEGFIVNDTMTPFMQTYLDEGMLFLASKLVAGAGIDEIRPLKMRYQGTEPMIPLRLTAVATEPHLTVTAYILGDSSYIPKDRPIVEIDENEIGQNTDGRSNYPMVLARTIDNAGGDGFVIEYQGSVQLPLFIDDTESGCCGSGGDNCGIGFDGVCQCPADDFDADDCSDEPDLIAAAIAYKELATKYQRVSRITTRISAEEMTFDPTFEPATGFGDRRLTLNGGGLTLESCLADVLEEDVVQATEIGLSQACASTYCGKGACALVGSSGATGCICQAGYVARQFTDLDGLPSITCTPDTNPVDFAAGGLALPDACKGRTCGDNGTCVDVGGFASCRCNSGFAASTNLDGVPVPTCFEASRILDAGGKNYTQELADIQVCDPKPPTCNDGYFVEVPRQRTGIVCDPEPTLEEQQPFEIDCDNNRVPVGSAPDDPNAVGNKSELSGCSTSDSKGPFGALLFFLGFALIGRRRKN